MISAGSSSLQCRELTADDIPAVLAVERGAYSSPWSLAMFSLELARAQGLSLGVWDGESLIAYSVIAPYDGVWHLMNHAVEPRRQRSGIGRALLADVLRRLEEQAILTGTEPVRMTLEVRESNIAARTLYRRFGFLAAGVRRRYYPDTGEDAIVLWRTPATLRGRLDDVPNADPGAAR